MVNVNIGLKEEARKELADELSKVLADTYSLYLKVQGFHWNLKGRSFATMHKVFQDIYEGLAETVDEVAERIQILGFKAPATFTEFAKLTQIAEERDVPAIDDMLKILLADIEKIVITSRKVIAKADEADDVVTADLLTGSLKEYEKTSWMIRSSL